MTAGGRPDQDEPCYPSVRITRDRAVSLGWLAPLVAIGIAAFLVYRVLPNDGLEITLRTDDASGIVPGSTLIRYRGTRIGIVRETRLDEKLEAVIIEANVEQSVAAVAREGTRFWVVRPRISLAELKGLETLISGPYITLHPGEGEPRYNFQLMQSPPADLYPEQGLRLRLSAPRGGSLEAGTPIFYRDVPIGEIYRTHLAADARAVRLYAYIEAPYRNLIRTDSVFWNASGLDVEVGLFGTQISAESITSILAGGIAVATPENPGPPVADGVLYQLEPERKDEWLRWSPFLEIPVEQIK